MRRSPSEMNVSSEFDSPNDTIGPLPGLAGISSSSSAHDTSYSLPDKEFISSSFIANTPAIPAPPRTPVRCANPTPRSTFWGSPRAPPSLVSHRETVGVETLPRCFESGRVAGDEDDGEALATGLAGHCGSEPPVVPGDQRGAPRIMSQPRPSGRSRRRTASPKPVVQGSVIPVKSMSSNPSSQSSSLFTPPYFSTFSPRRPM